MKMNPPEGSFKIIEDNNCPLYEIGDEFRLSGNALLLPRDRVMCLILAEDIIKSINGYSDEFRIDGDSEDTFDCGGCNGVIRLTYSKGILSAESGRKKDKGRQMPDDPAGRKNNDNADEHAIKNDHDIETIATLLSDFSFFQSLEQNDIKELVSYLKLRKFLNGEFIIKKGEPGTRLFIILFGKVEVVGDDGLSIAFLGRGEVFGEMSLLSGDPVGATIKVVDPTTLLYIHGRDFRNVLTQFPSLQMYFARLLARRLAKTNVARTEELSSGMVGKLSEMPPSELFQTLNANQKTGVLTLNLPNGNAAMFFKEGKLIRADYNNEENKEAFYEVLKQKEGRFKFIPDLPPELAEAEEVGDFMWLLMEGIRRMDEACELDSEK